MEIWHGHQKWLGDISYYIFVLHGSELIQSSLFQVTVIIKILKIPKAIAHGFFQKMAPKSPQIFITFYDTY